jgi:Arc/MetJ-type ribon-helix-helix transcriptional regulator
MGRRRKVTLVLDEAVVYGIREGVEAGLATSQSRLVQDAVVEYLDAANRKALGEAYADAARDPKFLADIERVRGDFERADEEITEG